jgi:beta-glucosidase
MVDARPNGAVTVTAGGETYDISQPMLIAEGKGWREIILTPACLGETGSALTFASEGEFAIDVSEITRVENAEGTDCSF